MNTQVINNECNATGKSENHPLSSQDATVTSALRTMLLPNKGRLQGPAARPIYDEIMEHVAAPEGVTYTPDTIGGIAGWWCIPASPRPGEAILYLHGGWYMWGTSKAYRHLAGHVAARSGVSAFIPDYRLAPEHPFPAALLDADASYHGLGGRGFRRIALVGDSAGGGLSLALAARAVARRSSIDGIPAGVVALSPVTDLAMTGPSWDSRAESDLYFTKEQCAALIQSFLGGQSSSDPEASPLYGKLAGLPPIQVHVGESEMLLDDSLRYVERAAAAGVDAKVDVWEGMQHVFPSGIGRLDAAAQALDSIGAFLSERLATASDPR